MADAIAITPPAIMLLGWLPPRCHYGPCQGELYAPDYFIFFSPAAAALLCCHYYFHFQLLMLPLFSFITRAAPRCCAASCASCQRCHAITLPAPPRAARCSAITPRHAATLLHLYATPPRRATPRHYCASCRCADTLAAAASHAARRHGSYADRPGGCAAALLAVLPLMLAGIAALRCVYYS